LAENENSEFILNRNPKEFTSARGYLSKQSRFRHLRDEDLGRIVRDRDKKWELSEIAGELIEGL
jgi:pyruvate ferredoxin oxidoreductase beta subunit